MSTRTIQFEAAGPMLSSIGVYSHGWEDGGCSLDIHPRYHGEF